MVLGLAFVTRRFAVFTKSTKSNMLLIGRTTSRRLLSTTPSSSFFSTLRRLDVAIVGLPNAGKSQLLNLLLQTPLAAVSRKRHTTRQGILGAYTHKSKHVKTQLTFMDTPGFLTLDRFRQEGVSRDVMRTAKAEMERADFCLLVVDAAANVTETVKATVVELMMNAIAAEGRIEIVDHDVEEKKEQEETAITSLQEDLATAYEPFLPQQKFAIVLNKVDLVYPKSELIEMAMSLGNMARECLIHQGPDLPNKELDDEALLEVMPTFFYTDAKKNEGVDDIRDFLLRKATPSEQFEIEEGAASHLEPEERAEEIIREKLYRQLHKELPYNIRQRNRVFHIGKSQNSSKNEGAISSPLAMVIRQDLIVQTKSHQQLVQGKGNRTLDRIQKAAQKTMEEVFHCEVALHLNVKLSRSAGKQWSID